MCLKKEYFEALELVEGGVVHLGDGKTCKIVGSTTGHASVTSGDSHV
ncbi:hypothetical protein A2U01_0080537, partial [Trifolium medium]|nr:hypothetical protein [Trifolium medium]